MQGERGTISAPFTRGGVRRSDKSGYCSLRWASTMCGGELGGHQHENDALVSVFTVLRQLIKTSHQMCGRCFSYISPRFCEQSVIAIMAIDHN